MAKKISELTEGTTIAITDLLPFVADPGGTPITKKITLANLKASIYASPVFTTKFEVRDGANGQAGYVYGTYTDASNYLRLAILGGNNYVSILGQAAGTGIGANIMYIGNTQNAAVQILTNNASTWEFTAAGHLYMSGSTNEVKAFAYKDANGVKVVGAQQALIADPTGGAIVDAEARTAIAAINALLKAHGLEASA